MKFTRRFIAPFLADKRRIVALILVLSVPTFGFNKCGDPKQIKQVAEAAKDIGGGTRDVIKAVDTAYDQKLLTRDQKDKLADLLIAIAKGGENGVNVIAALEALGAETVPPDQQQILTAIFDDQVIAPFLQLLTELANLSPASSVAIRAALVGLRGAILLLSQRIGRNDVIDAIHELEVQYAA